MTSEPSRKMGALMASGRTADVYAWGDGHILKLFHAWVDPSAVATERGKAQAVHNLGLPTPAVGEIVQYRGHAGLIYDRIDGPSLAERLASRDDDPAALGRLLARLHAWVHAMGAPRDFPRQTDRLAQAISGCSEITEHQRSALLTRLATLPAGDRLCHGDFHPDNVLLTESGPLIIDWPDASRGSPAADVARTSIICLGYAESVVTSMQERILLSQFHESYLTHYLHLKPCVETEYRLWLPVVAAARLAEGIPEERRWLLHQVSLFREGSA